MQSLLETTGFADAVIGRRVGDKIELLDGHMRADLAGSQKIPVMIVDLNDEEAELFLLTFDPVAAMAKQNKNNAQVLRTKALSLRAADYDKIVSNTQVVENATKQRVKEQQQQVLARRVTVTVGSIQVPCTQDEVAGMILLITEYADAQGTLVGFGSHLLKMIGEAPCIKTA